MQYFLSNTIIPKTLWDENALFWWDFTNQHSTAQLIEERFDYVITLIKHMKMNSIVVEDFFADTSLRVVNNTYL